jgi:hypothetical protein
MTVMLCVDGLSLFFSSKDLRQLAGAHGQVLRCWIVTQPGSAISMRFGFVEAATGADAECMIAGLAATRLNCKPCNFA